MNFDDLSSNRYGCLDAADIGGVDDCGLNFIDCSSSRFFIVVPVVLVLTEKQVDFIPGTARENICVVIPCLCHSSISPSYGYGVLGHVSIGECPHYDGLIASRCIVDRSHLLLVLLGIPTKSSAFCFILKKICKFCQSHLQVKVQRTKQTCPDLISFLVITI